MDKKDNLNGLLREIIKSDEVLLSIRDAARAGKVTTSQIRYWVKSGYIKTEQAENGAIKLPYDQVVDIRLIKHFLDEGYTLTVAAKKAQEHENLGKSLRHFFLDGIQKVTQSGKKTILDLGALSEDPQKHIYCVETSEAIRFTLKEPK